MNWFQRQLLYSAKVWLTLAAAIIGKSNWKSAKFGAEPRESSELMLGFCLRILTVMGLQSAGMDWFTPCLSRVTKQALRTTSNQSFNLQKRTQDNGG